MESTASTLTVPPTAPFPPTAPLQRQYLRVKRRRTDAAPTTLRLEGLLQQQPQPMTKTNAAFASLSLSSSSSPPSSAVAVSMSDASPSKHTESLASRKRSTTAVLRRVTRDVWQQQQQDGGNGAGILSSTNSSSFRLVNAVLDDDGHGESLLESGTATSGNKRRRLTLVDSKTIKDQQALEKLFCLTSPGSSKKKKALNKNAPIKVLNPMERMVDESLKQVYQGEITPRQHYNYVTQNPSLTQRRRHWLVWSNAEMGNLLHACALWNDAELAAELLQQDANNKMGSQMASQVDGDGRTPYQVAETMGHGNVMQVMEAFGADASNYVYDLYCLVDSAVHTNMNTNGGSYVDVDGSIPEGKDDQNMAAVDVDSNNDWLCQVDGGYAYFDADGNLMLEAGLLEHEWDNNDSEKNNEEDEDSNDEGYIGNDYPDENDVYWGTNEEDDDKDDGFDNAKDDGDDDDDSYQGYGGVNTFRRRQIPSYDYAEDVYDASYGIYGRE